MKRPSFQFYPADWRNNAKLRRCTFAERGLWIEIICLLNDSDEYGVLRWSLKEIARAIGCRIAELQCLVRKNVMKGTDTGQCPAYLHTPRSGRKEKAPVTLIAETPGPVWYSSRMVLDEYRRTVRGEAGENASLKAALDASPKASPKGGIGEALDASPKATPDPSPSRARASSSSSPSGSSKEAAAPPPDQIWGEGLQVLTAANVPIESARTFVGKCLQDWPADTVLDALQESRGTASPKAYVMKLLQSKPKKPGRASDNPTRGAI
jgi:hypothetical protein